MYKDLSVVDQTRLLKEMNDSINPLQQHQDSSFSQHTSPVVNPLPVVNPIPVKKQKKSKKQQQRPSSANPASRQVPDLKVSNRPSTANPKGRGAAVWARKNDDDMFIDTESANIHKRR